MKHFSLPAILLFSIVFVSAQVPGQWTWKGGSQAQNFAGVYGTKGVPAASNMPPGLYEAPEWQDQQGNFWLYGGEGVAGFMEDLWKLNLTTMQWTWMGGSGLPSQLPKYGLKGVPSTTNSPGLRMTSATWVDKNGKFWLFGGIGSYSVSGGGCGYSDLWKYDPANNTWTWMKGDQFWAFNPGVYGTKGVEDSLNIPPFMTEMGVTWVDDINGDLWMLDAKGALWKYRIQTNNWTWMKGSNAPGNPPSVFGSKGVPAMNNSPGKTLMDFTRWKDSKGDFWYLFSRASNYLGVLWKYSISTNMWTWVEGDTTFKNFHNYGNTKCNISDSSLSPKPRLEGRSCWIDKCDNLWVFSGASATFTSNLMLNDLVFYSTKKKEWVWVHGDTIQQQNSTFGTINVPSASNKPASRSGALPFKDQAGNLWFFGGISHNYNSLGDVWMFTPDTNCTGCSAVSNPTLLTGIELQNNDSEPLIHPNPSAQNITISNLNVIQFVTILDIYGKEVFRKEDPGEKLKVELVESGIYFVKLQSGTKTITRKVIITGSQ